MGLTIFAQDQDQFETLPKSPDELCVFWRE
jgi:hypothetical protein